MVLPTTIDYISPDSVDYSPHPQMVDAPHPDQTESVRQQLLLQTPPPPHNSRQLEALAHCNGSTRHCRKPTSGSVQQLPDKEEERVGNKGGRRLPEYIHGRILEETLKSLNLHN